MTVLTAGSWKHIPAPLYFHSALQNQIRLQVRGWPLLFAPMLLSAHYWKHPESTIAQLAKRWVETSTPVMFDSGVFTLFNTNTSNQDPYTTAPDFTSPALKQLLNTLDLLYGDVWWQQHAWGFVEVDLGDPEQKTRTREQLEDKWGIGLIPVFHFGRNPWAYLHWLVDRYDRVCLSMPVDAYRVLNRSKLLTEVNDRFEDAEVWFHELGAAPGLDYTLTWKPHSFDSTSWMNFPTDRKPLPPALVDLGWRGFDTLRGCLRARPQQGVQFKGPKTRNVGLARQFTLGLLADECRVQNLQHLHAAQEQIGAVRANWRGLLPAGATLPRYQTEGRLGG